MKRTPLILLVATVALAVAACSPSTTVENYPSDGANQSGISVNGRGQVTGAPDTLTMTFGVDVRRDTVDEAVNVAAERADALIEALKDSGVAEEDIQTANYSIWPEYDWTDNRQELIGYRVTNSVIAKVRDLESAGETIDAATAAGGNEVTVHGVSFSIEDNDALIEAARQAAWDDAFSKAEQLASLSGVDLGSATSISEDFSTPSTPIPYAEFADELAATDGAFRTPIEAGEQSVVVNVSVQFRIEG